MKIAGIILTVLGIIASAVFAFQAIQDSESFNFLGLDIAVSSANWTPLIISAVVTVVGILMIQSRKLAS